LPAKSLPWTGGPRHSRRDLDLLVSLSRIEPERLVWLSPGRLAAGKLTILDGDPGLGKSTLLCDFAARLTRGEPLPGGQPGEPRGVIILSAEDDLFDTIRPRLDAAGGDPKRIYAFPSLPEKYGAGTLFAIPSHLPLLDEAIARLNVALVIFDPLVAFLERGFNANSDQHVRRAGVALKDLAERTGVAIVAVRHLNKNAASNPLYRGGGSIGIIAAARCGLLLAADPDDPTRRILATSKANLASPPASLAFRLLPVPGSDVARVSWEGESPYTAAELLRPLTNGERATALDAVRDWLRQTLSAGPRPASEMLAAAEANGLSLASLRRARQAERVVVRKARGHHGAWIWSLPDADDKDAHPAPSPTS
jgi:putative DNA primase/helicase